MLDLARTLASMNASDPTALRTLPQLDWASARAIGVRLVRPGPRVSAAIAAEAVADLRRFAVQAQELVRETARIDAPTDTAPVDVIERTGWLRANTESLADLVPGAKPVTPTGRIAGAQIGAVLAWMSTKVLGQFDVFAPDDVAPAGRLLLVAPNIVHAERELRVDPQDFRLWVCLHEETHRVQFTAFGWLRDYLREQARALAGLTDLGAPAWSDVGRLITGRGESQVTLLDLLPDSGPVRSTLERMTAVMSLLEGHADVVMDEVGPRVIGSVEAIRRRFERRRDGRSGLDRTLRRMLGLDVKVAQYRDGARFCRAVIAARGVDGLNVAFASEAALPTLAEIHSPGLWIDRLDRLTPEEATA